MDGLIKKLGKYKYLLLVLALGLVLILLPSRGSDLTSAYNSGTATDDEARLEAVLGEISGVGSVRVLRSEEGVVVVCRGASSPQVRLNITEAVMSYTGLGSDRIRVMEMKAAD